MEGYLTKAEHATRFEETKSFIKGNEYLVSNVTIRARRKADIRCFINSLVDGKTTNINRNTEEYKKAYNEALKEERFVIVSGHFMIDGNVQNKVLLVSKEICKFTLIYL